MEIPQFPYLSVNFRSISIPFHCSPLLLFTHSSSPILAANFKGPPSAAQNFQVLQSRTRANSITVMWERPLITGRDDYFYNIQYSNPDNPGSFVQHNSNPLVTTSPVVRYSLSGLRPQTGYTIRLTVLNGVSEQDSSGEEGRSWQPLVISVCIVI